MENKDIFCTFLVQKNNAYKNSTDDLYILDKKYGLLKKYGYSVGIQPMQNRQGLEIQHEFMQGGNRLCEHII